MKNWQLVEELQQRDPNGDVQIFVRDEKGAYYYDLEKVNGFANLSDTVLESGEVRCTAP